MSNQHIKHPTQAVQQMTISLCTGHFPPMIMASTAISLLSLSWGASRAYFIERSQDKADPDPALFMVLMRVFPLMLVVVLNSLVMWVMIAGLIGPLIFPALFITFVTDYALVRAFIQVVNCPTIWSLLFIFGFLC